MRTRLVITGMLAAFLQGGASLAGVQPKLQTMEQYTRIQLPAGSGSTFRLVNGSGEEAVIVLTRVRPASLEQAASFTDGRVASVTVSPSGLDTAEIRVKFREKGTESFAYLQGGALVLDLWRQSAPKAVAAPKSPAKPKAKVARKKAKPKPERKIASKEAEQLPGVVPLEREKDLFQRFILPMPELRVESGKFSLPPAAKVEDLWHFSKGDKSTGAGEAFEFAKKLYQEKKYGLALKTLEISQREHADSPHHDEAKLLEAFCYRKLADATKTEALFAKSERMLEELAARRDTQGKPLPFQRAIQFYFAQREYNKGNWLQSIQHLEGLASSAAAGDESLPFIQIMLAEAYSKVDQPRRAERIYRFLYEKFPKHVVAKESRYRVASLLALDQNYKRVTEEGEGALKTYPEYEKARSEVLFQMGEANFWLGNYSTAEKYFRRFTEISSAQTNSALAWVRIGEISELARKDLRAARAAYLRAKNGYPFSQGDLVASVRLARIDLPVEKEPQFVVKTLQEMLADKSIDSDLKRMAELTLADYLLLSGETDKAIGIARNGMAQTDGKAYEAYKRTYMHSLYVKIEGMNRDGKFADGLALYDRERKWLDLYGADTYKAVADTYRGLGLYATSNDLMERYAREARGGRGLASAGKREALGLAKAKNSFARGAYGDTLASLPGEGGPEVAAIRAISEYRLGRKKVAYSSALKAVAAAQKGDLPDSMLEDLAEILIDRDSSEMEFARMEKNVSALSALAEKDNERLAYAAADALWYQKKHQPAIASYKSALEKFPKGERAERARYNIGMSYISLGNRAEAVKQLTELSASSQSVWAESARQELELVNWEKKYSSVLKTLPPSGLGISK